MEIQDIEKLDAIIKRAKPLHKGDHVYHAEQEFSAIYAVRSGSIKTYSLTNNGEEQVTGFYLPGEILGIDALHTSSHEGAAKALETSSVCEIPFSQFEKLAGEVPHLQRHFFQLLSKEIKQEQELSLLLSKRTADERMASLMVGLSRRHQRRRLSPTEFRLPMARSDIANYLGLAVETVSRVLGRLQQQNIAQVSGREVHIEDYSKLCALAHGANQDNDCDDAAVSA